VLFGAGEGAQQVITAMLRDPDSPYLPVALLDDDLDKRNLRLSGVRVLGTREDLQRVAEATSADGLLVAIPSADASLVNEMAALAQDAGLAIKVVPPVGELFNDRIGLGDIRDRDRLVAAFQEKQPEVVFHAAALKHLTLLERNPAEAVKSNIVGTLNVLDAATKVGVSRFVNISTDKAADPASVLGYTKRIAERLTAAAASRGDGCFLSVRFGNVLGSRGSMLSTFHAQIAQGGPITVTDPDVTRYFMTVHEAVELVIQAAAIGRDGEALVLDMGEPVRIADVARRLASQADRPCQIIFTGLRPGEKLHEALIGAGEPDTRPVHPMISHVPVPPLNVEDVAALDRNAEACDLIDQLARLASAPAYR
jgi:FlaA1/EpsC-like NDP-sugar epimerase